MNRSAEGSDRAVSPEEVGRRIAEHCREGLERQAPPQVVYLPAQQPCPWPDCGCRISGIRFQLDLMGTPRDRARWIRSWWQGPGLIGRCPGCGRYVLFGLREKRAVADTEGAARAVLPDDWSRHSHVVMANCGQ
jgi:hypothetical protein